MKKLIQHTIPISAEKFWTDLFFCHNYTEKLHLEGLQCSQYKLISDSGAPEYKRVLFNIPKLNIPRSLQKVFGDSIGYTERGFFDPQKKQYHFDIETSKMSSKIKIAGFYFLEDRGKECIRNCSLEFQVSIFGIGKKIETIIADQFIENQDISAEFCKKWISENQLG